MSTDKSRRGFSIHPLDDIEPPDDPPENDSPHVDFLRESLKNFYRKFRKTNQAFHTAQRAEAEAKEALRRRNPRRRKEERDAEIVYLRDVKRWKFSRIANHFKMRIDAAEKAYHRAKQRLMPTK